MIFTKILMSIQQFIESTGYPLIMQGIKTAGSLLNYKIYGNTKQERASRNLFDVTNNLLKGNYLNATTGEVTTSSDGSSDCMADFISATPNTTYTLSRTITSTTANTYIRICAYDASKTFLSTIGNVTGSSVTGTTPENTAYIRCSFGAVPDYSNNIQLELGSTATPYEPYGEITTPTPDYPIEVQGVGVKTVNLFDASKAVEGYISDTTGILSTRLNAHSTDYIEIEPDTQYMHSALISIGSGTGNWGAWYDESKTYISGITGTSSVTSPSNAKYMRMTVDYLNNNPDYATNYMVIKGSTLPDTYEPYGYKIPVTASGKNLFDGKYYLAVQAYGVTSLSSPLTEQTLPYTSPTSWSGVGTYINVKKGEKYIFTCSEVSGIYGTSHIFFLAEYASINDISNRENALKSQQLNFTSDYTYTIENNGVLVVSFIAQTADAEINITDLQIEKGSTATDYEPYHTPITTNVYVDEPLYKVGDYADYIDFDNNQVVRNIVNYTFTGNESWQTGASYKYSYKANNYIGTNIHTGLGYMTNQKISATQSEATSGTNTIYPTYSKDENLTRLYTDLNADTTKLANGIAYFARITPTTETADFSALPVFEGTTIYTVDEGLEPSDMYGKGR